MAYEVVDLKTIKVVSPRCVDFHFQYVCAQDKKKIDYAPLDAGRFGSRHWRLLCHVSQA